MKNCKKSPRRALISRKELRILKEAASRNDSKFGGAALPLMTYSQLLDYLRLTPAQDPNISPVSIPFGEVIETCSFNHTSFAQ